jgi:hypothetical protein
MGEPLISGEKVYYGTSLYSLHMERMVDNMAAGVLGKGCAERGQRDTDLERTGALSIFWLKTLDFCVEICNRFFLILFF